MHGWFIFTHYFISEDEDCLYVYVYVPKEKITGYENLEVIVHIHGGAFMFGSPAVLAGPDYLMDHDVIYVSFNYRLNILGGYYRYFHGSFLIKIITKALY